MFQFPKENLPGILAEADQIVADIKGIYANDPEELAGLARCMIRLQTNQRLNGNDYRRLTHALHVFMIGFGAAEVENQMNEGESTEE